MVGSERTRPGRARRIGALLEAGDHRAAAAEAMRVLADRASGEDERRAAGAALSSLRPEPGAVAVGVAGVLLAMGIALRGVLGSFR